MLEWARMDGVDIGIVIVSYNTRELLRRCLESVLSSASIDLKVCVVDNDSHDGSIEMVTSDFPSVSLIANDTNVGYPAANNQGLALLGFTPEGIADAPRYALLLNSDTEVPPDAFAQIVAFADAEQGCGGRGAEAGPPRRQPGSGVPPLVSDAHGVGLSYDGVGAGFPAQPALWPV